MRASRRSLLALGLASALGALVPPLASAQRDAAPASFGAFLRAMSSLEGLEARFTEEKTLSLLTTPLRSTGTLYYHPSGRLLRRVEAPRASSVLVSERHVRIEREGRVEEIDLGERPEVQPLVESLLWLLAGDEARLRATYTVGYEAGVDDDAARFSLTLRPRGDALRRILTEMRVSGRGRAVERIEVDEANGDRSVTTITDANPRRRFGAAEARALFGLGG